MQPHIGQTHSKNSSVVADESFESVWPVYGIAVKALTFRHYSFSGKVSKQKVREAMSVLCYQPTSECLNKLIFLKIIDK